VQGVVAQAAVEDVVAVLAVDVVVALVAEELVGPGSGQDGVGLRGAVEDSPSSVPRMTVAVGGASVAASGRSG
jgi:hypothetical protein